MPYPARTAFASYHMERFEGADNLVGEMNFSEELVDENNSESGMKYTLNGTEISYDEYTELHCHNSMAVNTALAGTSALRLKS